MMISARHDILSEAATGILVSVKRISRHISKTESNTRPTYINLGAEDNAVTMSANDPSVAQFIQEMPSLEDTDEDSDIPAEASGCQSNL